MDQHQNKAFYDRERAWQYNKDFGSIFALQIHPPQTLAGANRN